MKIIGDIQEGDSVIVINKKKERQPKVVTSMSKWNIEFDDKTSLSQYTRTDSGNLVIHADNPLLDELEKEHIAYKVVKYVSWNTSKKLKDPALLEAISNLMDLIDEDVMNADLSKLVTLGCAKNQDEYVYEKLSKLEREY
jgi:hypothetical protein